MMDNAHDNGATQTMADDADNDDAPRRRQQGDTTAQRNLVNGQQRRRLTRTQMVMPPPRQRATMQTTITCRDAHDKVNVSRSRRRIRLNKDPIDVKFMLIK